MSMSMHGTSSCTRLQSASRSGLGSQEEPPLVGDIDLSGYEEFTMPVEFTTVQRWKTVCLEHYRRLVGETTFMGTEYLIFSKVTKGDLEKIDRAHGDLKVRILYDSSMELLIVKLMVGRAHEWVDRLFSDLLRGKVDQRSGGWRVLLDMGASRWHAAGGCEKEPDVALKPWNRNREDDWPSLVIEVGVLESLGALCSDVHFWISNGGGMTCVVLLIAVDRESRSITIERWGDEPPLYPLHVVGPNIRSRKLQAVAIDANAVVGAPLEVPSNMVFDAGSVPAGVLPSDFTFDVAELRAFYAEFWAMLT